MLVWQAHKAKLREMAFSPNNRYLATVAGNSKYVAVWEAADGKFVGQLGPHNRPVRHVAFTPCGRLITSDEVHIRVWGVEEWRQLGWLSLGGDAAIAQHSGGLAVNPADGRLVVMDLDQWLVWDAPTRFEGKPRRPDRRVRTQPAIPTRIGFSAGGSYFFAADGTLDVYDPAPGSRPLVRFSDPGIAARATLAAFTRDDAMVAVAFGQRVAVWPLAEPGAKPVAMRGHTGLVRAVGFHPSGELLTAGMDGRVRVWDALTGTELRSLDWDIGKVQAATISADGTLCAAGSDGGHVVVWDADG